MHGVYGDEIINFTAINCIDVKRHDSLLVDDVFFAECIAIIYVCVSWCQSRKDVIDSVKSPQRLNIIRTEAELKNSFEKVW